MAVPVTILGWRQTFGRLQMEDLDFREAKSTLQSLQVLGLTGEVRCWCSGRCRKCSNTTVSQKAEARMNTAFAVTESDRVESRKTP